MSRALSSTYHIISTAHDVLINICRYRAFLEAIFRRYITALEMFTLGIIDVDISFIRQILAYSLDSQRYRNITQTFSAYRR